MAQKKHSAKPNISYGVLHDSEEESDHLANPGRIPQESPGGAYSDGGYERDRTGRDWVRERDRRRLGSPSLSPPEGENAGAEGAAGPTERRPLLESKERMDPIAVRIVPSGSINSGGIIDGGTGSGSNALVRGRSGGDDDEEDSSDERRDERGSYSDTGVGDDRKTKIYSKYAKKIRRKPGLKTARDRITGVVRPSATLRDREDLYDDNAPLRVSAFCICDGFKIADVIEFLQSAAEPADSITVYADVIQIKRKSPRSDIFLFGYGCVCFFNVPKREEEKFLFQLMVHAEGRLHPDDWQQEDLEYVYGEKSAVFADQITLQSKSSLEKLSVAFALAQCVKLSVYEERIQKEMDEDREIPLGLARTGSVGLTKAQISRKIGKLFIERNNVNNGFDVLDTPEFFWENDKYKGVYDRLFGYLELAKRVELLNKRLDMMKELLDMLADEQKAAHASKLEMVIIYLILVEVIIQLFWNMLLKDILGFFSGSD